jgi:recombination protein RecA
LKKLAKKKWGKKEEKPIITVPDDPKFLPALQARIAGIHNDISVSIDETNVASSIDYFLPSSSFMLDMAMGYGYPSSRIIEIVSEEARGKSFLGLAAIAQAELLGGGGLILDTENKYSPTHGKDLGIHIGDKTIYAQCNTVEQAFDIQEEFISTVGQFDKPYVILWDSVAATGSDSEDQDEDQHTSHPGGISKILGEQLRRRIIRKVARKNIYLIYINQLRFSFVKVKWGPPKMVSAAGMAVRYYASVRIKLDTTDTIPEKSSHPLGVCCTAKVIKNCVSMPFRTAEFNIMFNTGIDDEMSILEFLVKQKVVPYSGGWAEYNEKKYRLPDLAELLKNDPGIKQSFTNSCFEIYNRIDGRL